MPTIDDIRLSLEDQLAELDGELANLAAALQALDGEGATPPSPHPRRRASSPAPRRRRSADPDAASADPSAARPRRSRRRGGGLSGQRLEALLAESGEGLSAVAAARDLSASPSRVMSVLRDLEAAGRVRREGSRRTSRWRVVTDERTGSPSGRRSWPPRAARRRRSRRAQIPSRRKGRLSRGPPSPPPPGAELTDGGFRRYMPGMHHVDPARLRLRRRVRGLVPAFPGPDQAIQLTSLELDDCSTIGSDRQRTISSRAARCASILAASSSIRFEHCVTRAGSCPARLRTSQPDQAGRSTHEPRVSRYEIGRVKHDCRPLAPRCGFGDDRCWPHRSSFAAIHRTNAALGARPASAPPKARLIRRDFSWG